MNYLLKLAVLAFSLSLTPLFSQQSPSAQSTPAKSPSQEDSSKVAGPPPQTPQEQAQMGAAEGMESPSDGQEQQPVENLQPRFLTKEYISELGFLLPIYYGFQVSSQFRDYWATNWGLGPVNLGFWRINAAVSADFMTSAPSFPASLIPPLAGSFNVGLQIHIPYGFYAEYIHNSSHGISPDFDRPLLVQLRYSPMSTQIASTTSNPFGLSDYLLLGWRNKYFDAAIGVGRLSDFSSWNTLLLPFYNAGESGLAFYNDFSFIDFGPILRLRFNLYIADLALALSYNLIDNTYIVVDKNITGDPQGNGLSRRGYAALMLRTKPFFIPRSQALSLLGGVQLSFGLKDRSKALELAPLFGFTVGITYRLIIPYTSLGAKGPGRVSGPDDGRSRRWPARLRFYDPVP